MRGEKVCSALRRRDEPGQLFREDEAVQRGETDVRNLLLFLCTNHPMCQIVTLRGMEEKRGVGGESFMLKSRRELSARTCPSCFRVTQHWLQRAEGD